MTVSRSGQNAGAAGHHSGAWQPRPCKPVETATSADVVVRVVTVSDSEIIPGVPGSNTGRQVQVLHGIGGAL